jgi:hypothetical protein
MILYLPMSGLQQGNIMVYVYVFPRAAALDLCFLDIAYTFLSCWVLQKYKWVKLKGEAVVKTDGNPDKLPCCLRAGCAFLGNHQYRGF